MTVHALRVFAIVLLGCLPSTMTATSADDGLEKKLTAEQTEFFEQKIRPVLVQHCYECHSVDSKNVKGGLLLDSRAGLLKGGDSGSAVVPGNVEDSHLIGALTHESFEMPPQGKLDDRIIDNFVHWVKTGAADPREGEADLPSAIDFEEARNFWAFQPVTLPAVPEVDQSTWPRSDIDHFILAQLEQRGLLPVRKAEKRELIRRATFDLIGLPPAPDEVTEFLADESEDAFARVIDRLLASKHYGERWGRYWLDVARYAEDQAHTFSVTANTNGYRYRDWVVEAFNTDMPYDRFVRMQIAGDLIGPDSEDSWDHLVALGFFGLGAQYYKNSDAAKAAADELDDRVDTLSRGFLGLTVSCARCHDHKFDPIPTQDYYSLAGIFRSSKLYNAPLCSPEYVQQYNDSQNEIKQLDKAFKEFIADAKLKAAEEKVDQISSYIQTVWKYQAALTNEKSVDTKQFAADNGVNEFLLKRWIGFLDPKQRGKVAELSPWFAQTAEVSAGEKNGMVPEEIVAIADEFQARIRTLIEVRDGVSVANLVKADPGEPHQPGSPRFVTPLVTKSRPTAGIDIDITGAKQLYLVVSDGGNGNSCDHSDWLNPKLISSEGETELTDLKWRSLDGFGGGKIGTNYSGKPLKVGGKSYENGIGVHAPSVIVYDLPDGVTRFKAIGGLDNSGSDQGGCGEQASVQFSVYTEKPTEGPGVAGQDLITKVLGKDGPFAVKDDQLEQFLEGKTHAEYARLKIQLDDARKNAVPMYPVAHSYAEGKPADMKVFVRGNPANQKDIAPRRFLSVLAKDENQPFKDGSGRRELAEAIASPDNPLTARVIVNRIWQHHFGRGIVGTSSNFGTQGEPPTHPDLLDFLAANFIRNSWSIKSLHRQIMLSSTYQLSSDNHDNNSEIDGDNRFLWKMNRRRLDVEAWRDALLDVSGRLDRTLGGPSTNLADAENVRRTVYAKISRHELDSLLRLFDFPDANITSAKRTETTVPQQQLFVLNSPFIIQQAKAFAARLQREAGDNTDARIERAFQLAYSRSPTDGEKQLANDFLAAKDEEKGSLTRWERYAQVLLAANEFMYLD